MKRTLNIDTRCVNEIINGILKYIDAFQPNYQKYLKTYAYCMGLVSVFESSENCYKAFQKPRLQNKCFRYLGPLYKVLGTTR